MGQVDKFIPALAGAVRDLEQAVDALDRLSEWSRFVRARIEITEELLERCKDCERLTPKQTDHFVVTSLLLDDLQRVCQLLTVTDRDVRDDLMRVMFHAGMHSMRLADFWDGK